MTTPSIENSKPNRIWLHRISHEMEISHPLLDRGLLTIGYSDWSSMDFLDKIRGKDGWSINERKFQEILRRNPKNRFYLWRFLVEIDKGDWVIVPSWRVFSVYRVISKAKSFHDLDLESSGELAGFENWHKKKVFLKDGVLVRDAHPDSGEHRRYDLGFYIKVEPIITNVSRYEYADARLTSLMKYRGSTKECSNLRESVEAGIKAAISKKPINLHSQILEASQNAIWKLLQDQLNPDKLEALVRWYFQSLGASQVTTPPKNEREKEGDGDIVATFEPLRTIYYIQAKHHTDYSDKWAINQIAAYTGQKCELAGDDGYTRVPWVISTAEHFNEEATRLANENGVLLINGPTFARMLLETGIASLDSAFS